MVTIEEGDRLEASFTGKRYTVRSVDGDEVRVTGLPPVKKDALIRDIETGKIRKVG